MADLQPFVANSYGASPDEMVRADSIWALAVSRIIEFTDMSFRGAKRRPEGSPPGGRRICSLQIVESTKAGGIWRLRQKLWKMSWESIRALGIGHRVDSG